MNDEERLHHVLGSSAYDRQPVWLRWVIGIALFAWFVPPMVMVFLKLIGVI